MTLKDAAARLNTTTDQVKSLVRDGKLKYINIGTGKIKPRYRFAETDIDDFEQQQRVREEPSCRFSNRKSQRHIIGSTSSSQVVGFTALRDAQLAKKPRK
jgi:excisionase family DNA binding protein